MVKRIEAFYSGQVQGVGFRFSVERQAVDLDIHGWVKNLPDGRVQLVGEAGEEALKNFLERIKQGFSVYISDIDLQWLVPTGEFPDFQIRF